jgi:cardiolipin synthase A/B
MYVGVIITILSENRSPSKSLAYILVIVFLPVVGLLVYYFVGKKPVFKKSLFDKRRLIDRLVTLEQWRNRSVFHRGLDSVCRLLAALL